MNRLETLHNRIDLINVPFTERGSRILVGREGDRIFLKLAERWEKFGGSLRVFRQRPPIIQNMTFLQADGRLLLLQTDSYPHLVRFNTKGGGFEWVFLDPETIYIKLPVGQFGIQFDTEGRNAQVDRRGGTLRGIRNIAYTTNARILENVIEPAVAEDQFRVRLMFEAEEGQALVLNITPRLGFNRAIPPVEKAIEAARSRWQAWLDAPPPVSDVYADQYAYAWWVMGQGLLNTRYYFSREALTPSKLHYVGVWLWDQSFHAAAYRHVNPRLAEDQLRIMLDHQQSDGMLPDAVHDEGVVIRLTQPVAGAVTKPPIIAWSALKIYETTGNLDFLAEIYEAVVRFHEWWLRDNRNEATGLCEYRHPFSSGLDDSPLWDGGMPVVAPDLNTYLYLQAENLGRMASLLGYEQDAAKYRARAAEWLERMIAVLWNGELGLFDFLRGGERIPILTPFSLLPIWTGKLPQSINRRLIEHLKNPATFWTEHPIPTVAINDPHFDPKQMWRGPMWPNINLLFVEGLEKIGEYAVASELRRKTLRTLMQHRDIFEYYDPLTADHPPKAAPIFGWSSAVFIELALQETAKEVSDSGESAGNF